MNTTSGISLSIVLLVTCGLGCNCEAGAAIPRAPVTTTPSGAVATATPKFKWSPVTATSYNLVVKNSTGTQVVNVTKSSSSVQPTAKSSCSLVSPKSLSPGNYSWRVRGKNSAGTGPWSTARTFTVLAGPPAPLLVAPFDYVLTTTPAYRWKAVAGAKKYQFVVFTATSTIINSKFDSADVGTTGTCQIKPATPLPNDSYFWSVRAINASGTGPWGATASFEVVTGWDEVTIPGDDARIQLVTPQVAETIDLTNGKSYEFAWTTNGIDYETPWYFYLVGHPANLANSQNIYSVGKSEDVNAGITKRGGILNITADQIAATGVTTDNGFYQWVVAGWYGAHPNSRTFRIKK